MGRALAQRFLELGHRVAGCTLGHGEVTALAAQLPAGHWSQVDLTCPDAVSRWADALAASFEVPQLVVSCAGVIHRSAPLWRLTADEATQVLRVNLQGQLYVLQSLLPAMIEKGAGVVVMISSGMATTRPAGFAPYVASKSGLEALTVSLARELPAGMAAVALDPGLVRTRILETVMSAQEAEIYPLPEVWARDAAPFLLSLSSDDNGRVIPLPGWG